MIAAPKPRDAAAIAGDDRQADADRALLAAHGRLLLDLARASVLHGFEFGRPLPVDIGNEAPALAALRACHVVLRVASPAAASDRRWRAGGVRPWRPLLADVAGNAFAAAFADRRHPPLKAADRLDLAIELGLLGPPVAIDPADARARACIQPGRDGVLVEWPGGSLALYPEAWAFRPTPAEFVAEAMRRALARGLDPAGTPQVYRFAVATAADGTPSLPSP
ncbi:MAG: AMMECR1 domain-containing protein [Alphaproteobacteria bacterium]|nr:AMMECR1 domain-containing protein [Alphaproteobacteria bacterium]